MVDSEEQVTDQNLEDRVACFSLFSKYAHEVFIKSQQFDGDLLASTNDLLLALPKEFVPTLSTSLMKTLQVSFKLGVGYVSLIISTTAMTQF